MSNATNALQSTTTHYQNIFVSDIAIFVLKRDVKLQLTRTSATNYFNRPFQALTQDVFIRADIAFSALEPLICLMGHISLLTYLLTLHRRRHAKHLQNADLCSCSVSLLSFFVFLFSID